MKINKNGKIFTIKVNSNIESFKKGGRSKYYQDGGKTNITYNGNKYVWNRSEDKFYDNNNAEVTDPTFISNLNNYLLEKGIAAPSIEKEVSKTAIELPDNEVQFNLNRDFKYDYIYNKKDDSFSFKDKKSNKGYKLLVDNPEADAKLRSRLGELDYDLNVTPEVSKVDNSSIKLSTSAMPELGQIDEQVYRNLDKEKEDTSPVKVTSTDKKSEIKEASTKDKSTKETGNIFNLSGDTAYTYMEKDGKFYYTTGANKDWTEINKPEAITKLQNHLDGKTSNSTTGKNNTQNSRTNSDSNYINSKLAPTRGGALFKDRGETIMSQEGDFYYIDGNKWTKITDSPWIHRLNKTVPAKAIRYSGYNKEMENFRKERVENSKGSLELAEQRKKQEAAMTPEDIKRQEEKTIQEKNERYKEAKKEKDIRDLSQGITRAEAEKDYNSIISIQKSKGYSYEKAKDTYFKIQDELIKIQIENNLDTREQAKAIYLKQEGAIQFKKGGTNNIMKTYKINNKVYTIKVAESFKKGGKPKYQKGNKYDPSDVVLTNVRLTKGNKEEIDRDLKEKGIKTIDYTKLSKRGEQLWYTDSQKGDLILSNVNWSLSENNYTTDGKNMGTRLKDLKDSYSRLSKDKNFEGFSDQFVLPEYIKNTSNLPKNQQGIKEGLQSTDVSIKEKANLNKQKGEIAITTLDKTYDYKRDAEGNWSYTKKGQDNYTPIDMTSAKGLQAETKLNSFVKAGNNWNLYKDEDGYIQGKAKNLGFHDVVNQYKTFSKLDSFSNGDVDLVSYTGTKIDNEGNLISNKNWQKQAEEELLNRSMEGALSNIDRDINTSTQDLKLDVSNIVPKQDLANVARQPEIEEDLGEENVEEAKGLGITKAKMKIKDFFTKDTPEEKAAKLKIKQEKKFNKSKEGKSHNAELTEAEAEYNKDFEQENARRKAAEEPLLKYGDPVFQKRGGKSNMNKYKQGGVNTLKTITINKRKFNIKVDTPQMFRAGGVPRYQDGVDRAPLELSMRYTEEEALAEIEKTKKSLLNAHEGEQSDVNTELIGLLRQRIQELLTHIKDSKIKTKVENDIKLIAKIKRGRANKVAYDAAGSMENLREVQKASQKKQTVEYDKKPKVIALPIDKDKNQFYINELKQELLNIERKLKDLYSKEQYPDIKDRIEDLEDTKKSYIEQIEQYKTELKLDSDYQNKSDKSKDYLTLDILQEESPERNVLKKQVGPYTAEIREQNRKALNPTEEDKIYSDSKTALDKWSKKYNSFKGDAITYGARDRWVRDNPKPMDEATKSKLVPIGTYKGKKDSFLDGTYPDKRKVDTTIDWTTKKKVNLKAAEPKEVKYVKAKIV